MSNSDKSIYGRKVFFIGTNANFEQHIIDRLRLMEYEVYAINDYRKAKPFLRKNADSICFFLTESQLSLKGWHNLIKSFSTENVFSQLDMGVILPPLPDDKKANFIAELNLEAGIFSLNKDMESLLHEIVKKMDEKQAKGLRKYVRANCLNEQANLLWIKDDKMFKLKIIDISSVGIAAKLSSGQANSIFINQIIEDVTLNIKSLQLKVDINITGIKSAGDFLLIVIMFTPSTLPEVINKIRKYIAENLHDTLYATVRNNDLDRFDYEKA